MVKDIAGKSRLAEYVARRDFAKTFEPAGKTVVPSSSTLRFVIQRHDARRLHYDLRLELDGVFKSWAVTANPRSKRRSAPWRRAPRSEIVTGTVTTRTRVTKNAPAGADTSGKGGP